MASSTAAAAEQKKPGSTRSRKSTPRFRAKREKNAPTEAKKTSTPRRRASPRNLRKPHETEPQKKNENKDKEEEQAKDKDPPQPEAPAAAVKEEEGGEVKATTDDKTELETTQQEELTPAQDTQLRRNYLQRIYRQLQSTHPTQDDTMIRQFATNVEMEACQKAATRSEYVAAMDQEIHKLMQFEMAQTNASVYTNEGQSFDNTQSNTQAQAAAPSEMHSGYSPSQISQSRSFEYAQALAKAQSQEANSGRRSSAFSTPRQSMSGENSFQSMMNNQSQGYGCNGLQQQQQQSTPNRGMSMQNLQQMGNQYYPTSSMAPPTGQSFSIQSNVENMSGQGIPQQQVNHFQMQPPYVHQSRSQQRVSTFQEFSAQIQHLDKSVLIELLWNQRGALAQWQRQAKQLELQLSAHQNAASKMGSPGYHSPYKSPMVGGGNFVSPNVSAEAEMQRARERNNARNMMPQYSYARQPSEGSPACPQAAGNGMNWGENVQAYWDKVRALKAAYAEQLRIAKRALANNSAPPNTLYSVKAQSVMNNIGLVINILDEQPTNVQPRKFDVLTSIESFIQITVVSIVRKVQSSFMTSAPQAAVTSGPVPAVATSAATYAPGMPLTAGQGTEHQYAGTEWSSSNSIFSKGDTSRQSSREIFADSAEVKSSLGRLGEDSTDTPTRMMDGLIPPVENSPTNSGYQYAPVRPESNDTAAMQTEISADQASVYEEAACMTPKEPSTPTSEFRLPTVSEMRPSPGATSLGGMTRDSKVMQSSVDVLNDFTDFPELDFDEDSSSFVKENNPSNVSRKRGIEDV